MPSEKFRQRVERQRDRVDQAHVQLRVELDQLSALADEAVPAPGPQLLYTVGEAARLLSTSERTVYKLIADGPLASVMIGHSRRIRAAALQEYVDQLPPG